MALDTTTVHMQDDDTKVACDARTPCPAQLSPDKERGKKTCTDWVSVLPCIFCSHRGMVAYIAQLPLLVREKGKPGTDWVLGLPCIFCSHRGMVA